MSTWISKRVITQFRFVLFFWRCNNFYCLHVKYCYLTRARRLTKRKRATDPTAAHRRQNAKMHIRAHPSATTRRTRSKISSAPTLSETDTQSIRSSNAQPGESVRRAHRVRAKISIRGTNYEYCENRHRDPAADSRTVKKRSKSRLRKKRRIVRRFHCGSNAIWSTPRHGVHTHRRRIYVRLTPRSNRTIRN